MTKARASACDLAFIEPLDIYVAGLGDALQFRAYVIAPLAHSGDRGLQLVFSLGNAITVAHSNLSSLEHDTEFSIRIYFCWAIYYPTTDTKHIEIKLN